MRKCPALSIISSLPSSSPSSSLHVRTLVQGGGGEKAGWVQKAALVQEWPGEWDERKWGPSPSLH